MTTLCLRRLVGRRWRGGIAAGEGGLLKKPGTIILGSKTTRRRFSTSRPTKYAETMAAGLDGNLETDYTHCVIGAGVVGLAIAARLAKNHPGTSTLLLERHETYGTETSSRNSEVIHAGINYPPDSLKTRLCIRGNTLLYALCSAAGIPHKRTGKWIVAQNAAQHDSLRAIYDKCQNIGVPVHFLDLEEAKKREPDVRAQEAILECPTTGIVDSHALMTYLSGELVEYGGDLAVGSEVIGLRKLSSEGSSTPGFEIKTRSTVGDGSNEEKTALTSKYLINASGLSAIPISNLLLPTHRHRKPYYAKGSYFSYSSSHPRPKTLIYPAPQPGLGGLGTHLTLDLSGRIRFGPDVEWVDDPNDYSPNESRMPAAIVAIKEYLPGVKEDALSLDYCGIRPKLYPAGEGQADFWIKEEEGYQGFVNLLGIESPGLTSSLAIAEYVEEIIYGENSGDEDRLRAVSQAGSDGTRIVNSP